MTADHLRPLLDSEVDTARFWRLAQDLARATVPDEIVDVLRLGRMTALCKPNGGVRGIVAGDMVRFAPSVDPVVSGTYRAACAVFLRCRCPKNVCEESSCWATNRGALLSCRRTSCGALVRRGGCANMCEPELPRLVGGRAFVGTATMRFHWGGKGSPSSSFRLVLGFSALLVETSAQSRL